MSVTEEDAASKAEWKEARARVDYYRMARVLSGRLRQMEKRARSANAMADKAEAELKR